MQECWQEAQYTGYTVAREGVLSQSTLGRPPFLAWWTRLVRERGTAT
jgi:hypothetical protein